MMDCNCDESNPGQITLADLASLKPVRNATHSVACITVLALASAKFMICGKVKDFKF